MKGRLPILLLAVITSVACRQAYIPPAIANPPNYLVVEGFIENNGADSVIFTLSRTVKLDSNAYTPELGATVTLEGSDNSSYPLRETGNGRYGNYLGMLNNTVTWRLHITSGGKQYASDYVPLVTNPPIDSINWVRLDDPAHAGIQIYANTHDPQNNTHYYRWNYQEVWEFHSAFEGPYQYVPGVGIEGVVPITDYTCWHYNNSSDIVLANSTQLSQDLIYEQPVVLVPLNSQEMTVRYSVLVTQYALTKDAFGWWQILQKNTEQIGSIFGVQPSANQGNIHCLTDTAEQVLGFVSGGNSRSQRIFITNAQVQPWTYNSGCVDMTTHTSNFYSLWDQGFLPWDVEGDGTIHYAYKTCVDCTLTGTNVQPAFW